MSDTHRPRLPNDHLGRSWVAATLDRPTDYESILLTLVTTNSRSELIPVGNAFIIYAHDNAALCLTAAHNFRFIKTVREQTSIQSHPTLPIDFKFKGTGYLRTDQCFAIWASGSQVHACRVAQVNYIENYDVAVFTVFDDTKELVFPARAALDFRMPKAGDEIALLGHRISQEAVEGTSDILSRELLFWFGVAGSSPVVRDRMNQSFSFESTIPVPPGLSGSPILVKPVLGGTLTVCGVASFDFSDPKALTSFMQPGLSTIATLWPSAGLGFEMKIEEEDGGLAILGDLIRRKFLDDRSVDLAIETEHSGNATHIRYIDRRFSPPATIHLETTGHPLSISNGGLAEFT